MPLIESLNHRLHELEASEAESRVADAVDAMITTAIEHGASDIHVEPTDSELEIKCRIDGVLQRVAAMGEGLAANVIARVKVIANLLTYRTDIPQDGRIDSEGRPWEVDLRVSTFPTVHGEKAVIRIFDPEKRTFVLEELGFADEVRDELERFIMRPQGVVLLTGPSGSGKTTTIYSSLRLVMNRSGGARSIVTIEDPVEYTIPGATQTQVNPTVGLTFANSLRSLLRQDPEIIMIGEIRDQETAAIAVEAGLTGHLVISTIHSGAAHGVFNRLLDMGVEPFLITSAVTLSLAQRLVRMLCPSCRRPAQNEDEFEGLSDRCGGTAFVPVGCEDCVQTGYRGRKPIAEILATTPELKQAILARADSTELERIAVESGMRTLAEHGIDQIRAGLTSPGELRRVLVL